MTKKRLRYELIGEYSRDEVETALQSNDPQQLSLIVVGVALHAEPGWAVDVCRRLASHADVTVRGNDLLGFGHLARLHGTSGLRHAEVIPLIAAGLRDADAYVRGQADAAADDLEQYLGWHIPRPVA